MNSVKYLNAVLSVIAISLIIIISSITGLIPSASAQSNDKKYGLVPLNADGSINVWVKNQRLNTDVTAIAKVDLHGQAFPVIIIKDK